MLSQQLQSDWKVFAGILRPGDMYRAVRYVRLFLLEQVCNRGVEDAHNVVWHPGDAKNYHIPEPPLRRAWLLEGCRTGMGGSSTDSVPYVADCGVVSSRRCHHFYIRQLIR